MQKHCHRRRIESVSLSNKKMITISYNNFLLYKFKVAGVIQERFHFLFLDACTLTESQTALAARVVHKWRNHEFTSLRVSSNWFFSSGKNEEFWSFVSQDILWGYAIYLKEANSMSVEMHKKVSDILSDCYVQVLFFSNLESQHHRAEISLMLDFSWGD